MIKNFNTWLSQSNNFVNKNHILPFSKFKQNKQIKESFININTWDKNILLFPNHHIFFNSKTIL